MKTFEIYPKGGTEIATTFRTADAEPSEVAGYPFADFDYRELIAPVDAPPAPVVYEWDNYIDIGPFYDRFGVATMDVVSSADPRIKAILQLTNIRKWIDLTRPDVAQSVNAIAAIVPSVTAEIRARVMRLPVEPHENRAVRVTYFNQQG